MSVVDLLLVLGHAGTGALWLGAMTYSLLVVQPRVPRACSDSVAAENLYRELGAGNRWPVVGLIAVLAGSGAALVYVAQARGALSASWWLAIGAKVGLLAAASVVFWWISWRAWPRRVFALPAELPAEHARFRQAALAMTALAGVGYILGIVAAHAK